MHARGSVMTNQSELPSCRCMLGVFGVCICAGPYGGGRGANECQPAVSDVADQDDASICAPTTAGEFDAET